MKTNHSALVTLITVAALSFGSSAATARSSNHDADAPMVQQEKPADVSGTWALMVQTDQGTGTPSVTLKQDGEKLTGNYSSQVFGEQEVTGTIKGNAITFSFAGSLEGNKFTVTYRGTVDKDTMKGKVSIGDMGEGTFTGKKK